MADFFLSPSRRRILKLLFGASLAAFAAPIGYTVTKYILPLKGRIIAVVAGTTSNFAGAGQTRQVKLGMKDAIVMRIGDGQYRALDLKCTHAGCIVHWLPQQNMFQCPCHGGEYNAQGDVIKGPPPRPLAHLQVAVTRNGEIVVSDTPSPV